MCVCVWLSELRKGDIMDDIFVDHCGVAVPLNFFFFYMFSQTVSTALLRLEYPAFLPKQTTG